MEFGAITGVAGFANMVPMSQSTFNSVGTNWIKSVTTGQKTGANL
jgi:hypothetical protein